MKQITILFFSLLIGLSSQSQSLDEVLNKYYETMGFEQLSTIKTMKTTGKSSNMGMETTFTIIVSDPDKYRLEVPIQGQTLVQVYNNGTAWMIAPWTGSLEARDLSNEEMEQLKKQADMKGPLYNWKEKGNQVELIGKEDMEGTPVYKVHLTYKNGDQTDYYIDAENYVILKEVNTVIMRGEEMKTETYYSDYKPLDKMMMAYTFEVRMNGQVAQSITIENVEIDPKVDNSIFEKPASPTPAPSEK